ncbi:MAG: hypothetical protein Tsb0020_17320 [Haliangiales bacterium]
MTHSATIEVTYDARIHGFIVSMPAIITLAAIEAWREQLWQRITDSPADRSCRLLIDTNQHQFESIACIKALRDALEDPRVADRCERAAFVAPARYRQPQIVSEREGYFNSVEAAYAWLERDPAP